MPVRLCFLALLFTVFSVFAHMAPAAAASSPFLDQFFKVKVMDEPLDVSDLYFATPTGAEFEMESQKGKWIILNIWATWCPPCVEELPRLDRLKYLKADKTFDVLAVAVDRKMDPKRIEYHLNRWNIANLRTLHDSDKILDNRVDTETLPVSYVINPEGYAVAALYGPAKWSSREAVAFVDALRKKPDVFKPYARHDNGVKTP